VDESAALRIGEDKLRDGQKHGGEKNESGFHNL